MVSGVSRLQAFARSSGSPGYIIVTVYLTFDSCSIMAVELKYLHGRTTQIDHLIQHRGQTLEKVC
jgi:hypothetical protein